jgi:DNA-binding XRE family transcriptional regulator
MPLKTNEKLITERLATDPRFGAEWERTAFARAVALEVVRYRSENGLSQRELAEMLLTKQPRVARIERGDTTPSIPNSAAEPRFSTPRRQPTRRRRDRAAGENRDVSRWRTYGNSNIRASAAPTRSRTTSALRWTWARMNAAAASASRAKMQATISRCSVIVAPMRSSVVKS